VFSFNQPQQTVQKCCPKTILLSWIAMFWLSSSHFNYKGHIMSTNGVALRIESSYNKFWFGKCHCPKEWRVEMFSFIIKLLCLSKTGRLVIDDGETFLQFLFLGRHRMWDDCVLWSCSVS
jgi:hypothetical protein